MNKLATGLLLSGLILGQSVASIAQHPDDHHENQGGDHPTHQYVQHNDWKKGHRMAPNDWNRGEQVDYRAHHLNAPRRGYEWREVDGNYVMAAVATGVIASIIVANGR